VAEKTSDLTELEAPDEEDSFVGIDDDQEDDSEKTIRAKIKNFFVANVVRAYQGIMLRLGFKAMEEKTYTISAAGWYKFAATSAISYYSTLANFSFEFHGSVEVGSISACLSRNLHQGDSDLGTCEYLPGKSMRTTTLGQIRVRMGLDSSSGSSAGITGEVYVPASGTLTVQKYGALAGISGAMLSLVDDMSATTDGLLPDEVTAATYLEAGSKFSTNSTTKGTNKIAYTAVSSTVARLVFLFDEIPKQDSTTATLTYDSFRLLGIGGSLFNFTGDETLGTPVVDGREVYIDITDTVNSPFGIGDGIVSRVDNVTLTLS